MITAPGIYKIPQAEYHADPCPDPSLSSSLIKVLIQQSPLHAWMAHPRLNPNFAESESETFDIGSACHALLLEGENRIERIDAPDFKTKAAREARDAARAAGKHPIIAHKYDSVVNMHLIAHKAIADCADLSGYRIDHRMSERTIVWQEDGWLWCRAMIDSSHDDLSVLLDYKSTTDATPSVFSHQISRMGYQIQESWYRRGVRALTGKDPKMIFLAQETAAPHDCSFHAIAPSLGQIADDLVEQAIRIWGDCLKRNMWPGYSNRIHYAEAAAWQINEHVERVESAEGIAYDVNKMWDKNEGVKA